MSARTAKKTPPAKPAKKTAGPQKPPAKKAPARPSSQMDLFRSDGENERPVVMIPIQVPSGTTITIGVPPKGSRPSVLGLPESPSGQSHAEVLREILALPKEEIREILIASKATAPEIIKLSTTAHGLLYRFAAIGGKVTSRNRE